VPQYSLKKLLIADIFSLHFPSTKNFAFILLSDGLLKKYNIHRKKLQNADPFLSGYLIVA
jgi:hypothetical protein